MSACDELDGSPSRHVARFQVMAPISAASNVCIVARCPSMMPVAIVFATATVMKAPRRLAMAAIVTATRGDTARVDTDVATAFAVS